MSKKIQSMINQAQANMSAEEVGEPKRGHLKEEKKEMAKGKVKKVVKKMVKKKAKMTKKKMGY